MTSVGTFSNRLSEIDELTRPDHSYLTEDDRCYFLGEYTARRGFSYSETNDVIYKFKKGVERRGRPEWVYKDRAIARAARAFREAMAPADLDRLTFVPIPPSKAKADPLYDDRMTRMLGAIRREPPPRHTRARHPDREHRSHTRDAGAASARRYRGDLSGRPGADGPRARVHRGGRRSPDDGRALPGSEIGPLGPVARGAGGGSLHSASRTGNHRCREPRRDPVVTCGAS